MTENKELQLFCEATLTARRKWNNYDKEIDTTIYNMASIGYATAWIKCTERRWKYARKKIYTLCGTYLYGKNYIERRRNYFEFWKGEDLEECRKQFKLYVITMLSDGDDTELIMQGIKKGKCVSTNHNFTSKQKTKLLQEDVEDVKTVSENVQANLNF